MDTPGKCLREYILTLGRPRMGVRGPLKPSGRLAEREPEGGKKRELVSRTSRCLRCLSACRCRQSQAKSSVKTATARPQANISALRRGLSSNEKTEPTLLGKQGDNHDTHL